MTQPLISIVIPAYNSQKYIAETLSSLQRQTYDNWEAVVVNDGSTDNTVNIVNGLEDNRISLISQENKGVKRLAETINAGVNLSRGELITMLPSDDLWPETRLADQIPIFEDPDVVLVHGRMTLIDQLSNPIGEARAPFSVLHKNPDSQEAFLEMLSRNTVFQPTVLIRKSALTAIGGYQQERYMYAEDYPTQLKLSMLGRFHYIGKVLAHYRIHPGQMTKNHQYKMIASDRVYVRRFLAQQADKIETFLGPMSGRIAEALNTRDVYDRYKLARHFSTTKGGMGKAVALWYMIMRSNRSYFLTLRLLGVIMISSSKRVFSLFVKSHENKN